MKAQRYFEVSEAVTPEALRNSPEDESLQQYHCENRKLWIVSLFSFP